MQSATTTPQALEDEPRGRSFSTDPRNRVPLSPLRLHALRRLEARITEILTATLEMEARTAALIARVGSDLSSLRFEDERPRFTHVGIALREGGEWWIHQLLNTHEGSQGHLYRQPLIDFFRDDPIDYATALIVPSLGLQQRIASVVRSPLRQKLYTPAYSRVAYPFSTRYINSNQWVAEIVAAAQGGGETRAEVQRFLAHRGLRPSVLTGIGPARQLIGVLQTRNTRFDDHPPANRWRGRLEFLLQTSLRAYLCSTDDVRVDRVVSLEPAPPDSRRAPRA